MMRSQLNRLLNNKICVGVDKVKVNPYINNYDRFMRTVGVRPVSIDLRPVIDTLIRGIKNINFA